ncbi:MAG: hypothetical protein DDT40_01507 [candidate division WS2 bacterium]|nr:hypothetical protein [Candidatus Psychracetigena formicireducens]
MSVPSVPTVDDNILNLRNVVSQYLNMANRFLEQMAAEMAVTFEPIRADRIWFSPNPIVSTVIPPTRPHIPDIPAVPFEALPMILTFSEPFPIEEIMPMPSKMIFTEAAYTSALLDSVIVWLNNQVIRGGTGLAPNVETAIWNRSYERDLQAYNDAVNEELVRWGQRGWTLPNDIIDARLMELNTKFMDSRIDRSRDIAIEQARLAQNNTQFTITNSITLEGIMIQHHNNIYNRALAAVKAIVDAEVAVLNAMVLRYNARLEAYKTKALTFTELEKAKISYYSARISKYKTEVEAHIARIAGLTDIYRADTSAYSARVNESTQLGQLRIEQQKMMGDFVKQNIVANLTAAQTNLQQFVSLQQAKIKGTEAGGTIYANLAASIANTITSTIAKVETSSKKTT